MYAEWNAHKFLVINASFLVCRTDLFIIYRHRDHIFPFMTPLKSLCLVCVIIRPNFLFLNVRGPLKFQRRQANFFFF